MTQPDALPNLLKNRSMMSSTIIPELAYPDVRKAATWLCRAFGFTERLQIGDHRSQLAFGDAFVVVKEGGTGPASTDEASHGVMVRVPDLDARFQHAVRSGARVVSPPTTHPYGERQCTVVDPGGHRWTFSQSVEDVDPAAWGGVLRE